jgi:hypothetical protein
MTTTLSNPFATSQIYNAYNLTLRLNSEYGMRPRTLGVVVSISLATVVFDFF